MYGCHHAPQAGWEAAAEWRLPVPDEMYRMRCECPPLDEAGGWAPSLAPFLPPSLLHPPSLPPCCRT